MMDGHSPGENLNREQQSSSPSTMTRHPDYLEVKQPQAITLPRRYFTVIYVQCSITFTPGAMGTMSCSTFDSSVFRKLSQLVYSCEARLALCPFW